jgi:hypothetical protein
MYKHYVTRRKLMETLRMVEYGYDRCNGAGREYGTALVIVDDDGNISLWHQHGAKPLVDILIDIYDDINEDGLPRLHYTRRVNPFRVEYDEDEKEVKEMIYIHLDVYKHFPDDDDDSERFYKSVHCC